MTTITHEQLQAILRAPCTDTRNAALADAGITIAPPDPPEAMVKLAREIAAKEGSWTERYEQEILDGRADDHYGVKIALAALQFADKAEAEVARLREAAVKLDSAAAEHAQALEAEVARLTAFVRRFADMSDTEADFTSYGMVGFRDGFDMRREARAALEANDAGR